MTQSLPPWQRASAALQPLPDASVDLWRAPLLLSPAEQLNLQCVLAPDEIARFERLRIPAKAEQFAAARLLLRQILGRYLGRAPASLGFCYGAHGKPALCGGELDFNLAHAAGWLLLAVSNSGPVGVDLEQLDAALDYRPMAARVLSASECAALATLPEARRRRAFYRLWTRHEARLKGLGSGWTGAAELAAAGKGWQLCNFSVGNKRIGALARRGNVSTIRRFELPSD